MRPLSSALFTSTLLLTTGCFSADTPSSDPDTGPSSIGTETSTTDASSTSTTQPPGTTDVDQGAMSSDAPAATTSDTGLADGSTTESGADTTPPQVVYFAPTDGASQVYEELVTIVFSEPMDRATVESAFPNATAFAWDVDGTQVEIQESFPFQDVPVLHDLVLPTSVTDLAGNGLAEPLEVTIGLAALRTVVLLHEPGLTGNSIDGADGNYSWFVGGDSSSNLRLHAGISFALAALPPFDSVLAIRRATYRSHVLRIDGNANEPGLGGLLVDHAVFDSRAQIDDPTILDEAFATLFSPGDAIVGQLVDLDVTQQLEWTWSAGMSYFQFRYHAASTNGNAMTDQLFLRRGATENGAIVPEGFTEPDPDNQSRIEIQYFQ